MKLLKLTACLMPLWLAGCSVIWPRVEVAEHPDPSNAAVPEPVPANGSIFATRNYRPLFEDHRARLVGDTLVVQIVEKVSASQKSTSTINKSSDMTAAITALPGIAANSFGRASVGATSANNFGGKGTTENTNDFSGTLTVTVRNVLPNGHLLVAGEKQIGVNANVDVLRFSGQVDPQAIAPGNTVASTAIANVRIEQRGRGQQGEAQAMSWLARVFLNIAPI